MLKLSKMHFIILFSLSLIFGMLIFIKNVSDETKCTIENINEAMNANHHELIEYCAINNFPLAMTSLAEMYIKGKVIKRDPEKWMEWNLKAAKLNDVNAMKNLGWIYRSGLIGSKNYDLAIEWLKKGVDFGSAECMYQLGMAYYEIGEYGLSREWRIKAADNGSSEAANHLGHAYKHGTWKFPLDYILAMKWYIKAADMGDKVALVRIGELYDNGLGVAQDYKVANEWYCKAAEKGLEYAKKLIQPNSTFLGFELAKATLDDFKKKFPKHKKLKGTNKFNNGSTYAVERKYIDLESVVGDVLFIFSKQNLLEAVLIYFRKSRFDDLKEALNSKYTLEYSTLGNPTYQSGNSKINLQKSLTSFSWRDINRDNINCNDFVTLIYATIPFNNFVRRWQDNEEKIEKMQKEKKKEMVKSVL